MTYRRDESSIGRRWLGTNPVPGGGSSDDERDSKPKVLFPMNRLTNSTRCDPGILEALIADRAPPQVVYAYHKTGLIVTVESRETLDEHDRKIWDAAMVEFANLEWDGQHSDTH